ncbi:bifunctional phosphoribosylaminoimidazolecarboxamide formyltransferase/IMP cyclohydrolase [Sporolituus thermophilus]|uniref:Bifunctional purine biosynthesis protein PurH n=1 Tax=Sporolituus thermophilus DSM 23256 TaxID=1123285 RepID=A0A1G7N6E1_9FIRM|nr:bifunctional phosphoribosylaminoimidazolecarboxamide formyltransferase/IMP cyclohydrolase [Sporolituus thermophilus]SDF69613.1 phosphoribosylaminoimidazolecarboxamide formyltransferase / IMP cyclohydrolase [Sporolituus thermophilus DSM 23256]
MKIKRALISVSDKRGLVEFAQALCRLGVELISTGGTLQVLRDAGLPAVYVGDVTGFPEMMDGRVKTLHPRIHGGILAVRDNPEHVAALAAHNIPAIDMVVVNLYPFRQTVAKPGVTLAEAVENIDIGGPAMVRAAAKNFRHVAVVVNPDRYGEISERLAADGDLTVEYRMALAREAYYHTAEYDACIAAYLDGQLGAGPFPGNLHLVFEKVQDLRYGENPHQQAAFYRVKHFTGAGIATARQLHGKELSFNNIVDLEAAYALANEFAQPAAVIIKHTNPCGTAIAATLAEAYAKAYAADPVSAFGGIVGFNREVDKATAAQISAVFTEAVVAPGYSEEALGLLRQKKNLRLLLAAPAQPVSGAAAEWDIKKVSGGILVQEADRADAGRNDMRVVSRRAPGDAEWEDLLFAWKVVKHVKSNAIVVAKGGQALGVGAGQMNRVGAAQIALTQAGEKAQGAVLASDAFFPFRDTVDAAARAGIRAIIQPGGSVRDEESIQAADEYGIALVFTGVRHFKH